MDDQNRESATSWRNSKYTQNLTQLEDILSGKSDKPLPARVRTQHGEFGADVFLSTNDPNIRVRGIAEISDPSRHLLAVSDFEKGAPELHLTGGLGYKEIPSRVAALRQAYLMMFRYIGYGYILFRHADCIRQQILNHEIDGEPLKGMLWIKDPPAFNAVAILKEPEDLRCFFVVLNLSTAVDRYLGVVMPGIEPKSEQIYKRWQALGRDGLKHVKPKVDVISYNSAFLTDPSNKHLALRIWRDQVQIVDGTDQGVG